jgi:hypothetical protein
MNSLFSEYTIAKLNYLQSNICIFEQIFFTDFIQNWAATRQQVAYEAAA